MSTVHYLLFALGCAADPTIGTERVYYSEPGFNRECTEDKYIATFQSQEQCESYYNNELRTHHGLWFRGVEYATMRSSTCITKDTEALDYVPVVNEAFKEGYKVAFLYGNVDTNPNPDDQDFEINR